MINSAEMNIESSFIGREKELNVLNTQISIKKNKVILITGVSGVGKTTLAHVYANKYTNQFPGGIYYLNTLDQKIIINNEEKGKKLIIWDNIEYFDENILFRSIEENDNNTNCVNILISRKNIQNKHIDYYLELNGLNFRDAKQFLHNSIGSYNNEKFDEILQQFNGNPLALKEIKSIISNKSYTLDDIVKSAQNFSYSGLVGIDGKPLDKEIQKSIVSDIRFVNDDLLKRIDQDPSLLYKIPPRKFEEVIAEIFNRKGYSVKLTQATRDGGKDIYAAQKNSFGSFLYIVECKKYSPDRPVGVELVRQLFGVLQAERATAGLLVTTSYFSTPAKEFQKELEYQISLNDFFDIQKWIKEVSA